MLEEHASSGLSVRAFCKKESLSEPSFYGWRRKLQGKAEEKTSSVELIPVRVVDEPAATGNAIEIIVPGDVRLRLGERCTSETLNRVLAAVRETFLC